MPTLHLIDGSGYVFRAYHAMPPMSSSKGVSTGAVKGVASMVLRDLRIQKPTHLAFCMDLDGKAKRLEMFAEYKANRPPVPDDLKTQILVIKDVIRSLGLPLIEVSGWEADDIIATLVKQAQAKGFDVVVVSGDKDLMQLVEDGKCRFYDGMKDAWFDEAAVKEKWGVPPKLVGDLLALTGDSVDNIPGVAGVGPKTATQLLTDYGNLDGVIARASEIKRDKLRAAIMSSTDAIHLSRRLVTLMDDVPLELTIEDLAVKPITSEKARPLLAELEIYSLMKELPQSAETPSTSETASTPAAASAAAPTEGKPFKVETQIIRNAAGLEGLAQRLETAPRFALRLLLPHDLPLKDLTVGWAFAVGEEAFYVPVGIGGLGQAVLSESAVLERLLAVLESPTLLKDGHSMKSVAVALRRRGVRLRGIGIDVELASFLTNSARREHELADLAREHLGVEIPTPPLDSRKRPSLEQSLPEELAGYAGTGAAAILRMASLLRVELERGHSLELYETLERPLITILAEMEVLGIRVDINALKEQASAIEKDVARELEGIYAAAGHEFNVNAPAQLAEVLFDELKLPIIKRGRTGPSTDAEVLEKLAEQHPLPAKILEYRGLSKLKNTYLDTLPQLVAEDGRVHTTFHQLGAATGRLSSIDPNLQNIPIRTEVGRRIRMAFVAAPGQVIVSADYSQIELRILAHVSGDAALLESFAKGEDVHTRTAAEVYGVPPDQVQPEMRRVAKMVNYAIAYGLSAFGLSARLDIERGEAKKVIEAYFMRYAGVKSWLDETVLKGKKMGYVETILGRRRQLADLNSRNPMLRSGAERAAVNAPIQGAAADIVKVAMLHVDAALKKDLPSAHMLLQVHDELLFEVDPSRAKDLIALVKPIMESAVKLSVPLVVDIGQGLSWADAH